MRHMYDQEAEHLRTFNDLVAKHRVRPTALYPLWAVLATGLGWGTAVMGREAAMACTEAVETEIGAHYNGQIRTLLEMVAGWEADGVRGGVRVYRTNRDSTADTRRGAGASRPRRGERCQEGAAVLVVDRRHSSWMQRCHLGEREGLVPH